jgi:hypothetical protein
METLKNLVQPVSCSVSSATDAQGNQILIVHTCGDPNCTSKAQ